MPSQNQSFRALLTRRVIVGLAFIYVAGLGYVGELIIPFLPIGHKVTVFIITLVVAESLFVIGIALTGKALYKELKNRLIAALQKQNRLP